MSTLCIRNTLHVWIKTYSIYIVVAVFITGCNESTIQPIDDHVLSTIATCNAGYQINTRADLSVSISRSINSGATLQAGKKQELKGLLLNSTKVTSENVDSIYRSYLNCVKGERSLEELLIVLEPRRESVKSELVDFGENESAEDFDAAYLRYIDALRKNHHIAAHESLAQIYRILAKAHLSILSSEGESVTFIFSRDDVAPIPLLAPTVVTKHQQMRMEERNKPTALESCVSSLISVGIDIDLTISPSEYCYSELRSRNLHRLLDPCDSMLSPEDVDDCLRDRFNP